MTTNIPPKEVKFGEVAVQKGLVTEDQLLECLTIQKQLEEMGIHEAVGEILQKKGYLKPEHVGQVLKAMGIDISPVPGYQIQAKLGQGGMGTVYKAKQVSMNRVVALKILSPEMTKNKEFVERFLREARSAAQMNHKNIIQAFDAGVQNGIYYFAMEYINGNTVGELLKKKGRFSEKRSLEVTGQVAEALEYLSRHGMVHRDIKPENIMISTDGHVKLCDFGLVKEVRTDLSVTRSGFTFGTPYYMSPEQIQGVKRLDTRADIYSLGTCFFKMLTGRNVFEGTDLQSVLTKHLTEKPSSPRHLVPDLSDAVCDIQSKMLEKDRAYRYHTPRELIHDIRSVLAGGEPLFARQRRGAGVSWGIGVAAAVLVVAFGLGGYFLLVKPERTAPGPVAAGPNRPVDPPAPVVAPPPPVRVNPTDEAQKRKEAEAEKMMVQANAYYEGQNWSKAFDQYQKLLNEPSIGGTKYVADNRESIVQRSARCKRNLDDLASKQYGTAEEFARVKKAEFDRAEAEYIRGAWVSAKERLEGLIGGALPDDLVNKVRERLVECNNEIDAEAEFEKIKTCAAQYRFELIEPLVQQYRERFKTTVTLGKKSVELKLLVEKAPLEAQCKSAVAQARKLFDRSDWEGFRAMFSQIRRDFASSDYLNSQLEELNRFGAHALAQMKAPREKEAAEVLKQADADFRDQKATAAMDGYRRALGDFGDTDLVKGRAGELESRVGRLEAGLKEGREKEAAKLFSAARADMDKKNFSAASSGFDKLKKNYADTALVSRESKNIDSMKERCDQAAAKESQAFVIDMTGGVDGWKKDGPTDRSIDESDEGSSAGKKSAKFRFPPHEDGWSRIEHPVPEGALADAKSINFRARSGERFTITTIAYLKVVDGKKEFYYMAHRDIGSGAWSVYKVAPAEFSFVPVRDSGGPSPKLDLSKVRAIGFCHPPKGSPYEMFVDYIKAETK